MSDEVLIYVTDPTPDSPALRVTLGAARQSSGGHLFIVPPETITDPAGARIIRSPADLSAISARLSASDSLFASAWFSRQRDKDRPGDGKSWDATDFDCP